ncbi:MAG: hypothetical protein ACHQIM_09405 [Sphingobacteriales bacterium]
MKKALILFLFISSIYQLKAQQLFRVNPAGSLSKNLNKSFLVKPDRTLPLLNFNGNYWNGLAKNTTSRVNHMPIIVLDGNDKMPVVKLGGYYTMPVKKIGSEDQITVERNQYQFLPTFTKPF